MKFTFVATLALLMGSWMSSQEILAQVKQGYIAPQDTSKRRTAAGVSLNQKGSSQVIAAQADPRLSAAAAYVARILRDSTQYDPSKGILITELFRPADLQYLSSQGLPQVVAFFEALNRQLPEGRKVDFVTGATVQVGRSSNPLVLDDLRMKIAAAPAGIDANRMQWQEHVYLAYMARDYGTKLENTITITSATRELRELPELQILNGQGQQVTLAELLRKQAGKGLSPAAAEQKAVLEFRMLTFPNAQLSESLANANYRTALLALIDLQEADFRRHEPTQALLGQLRADLQLGAESKVWKALKNSTFFDLNVPGHLGPVLLTEGQQADPEAMAKLAESKALELLSLTALHYGERDAVKLFNRILVGGANADAAATGDFSTKRLAQLKYHGVEKIKSLGFGPERTAGMQIADLVLVAVASPDLPPSIQPEAYLKLLKVGRSIIASYHNEEVTESRNIVVLEPHISLGSRHYEYVADFDPVDFARQSLVSHNGVELRLESDVYFSHPNKLYEKGLKPFFYPEFGVLFGIGKRKVGYEASVETGPHGAVPKFKQNYENWGGHIGMNVGPVLVAIDAMALSTPGAAGPREQFFDLSESMIYYRYSFQARLLNLGISSAETRKPLYLSLDLEVAGETNNEGTLNRTRTQDGGAQIDGKKWQRAYERARPGGVYNQAIAEEMIQNGDVKASYAAASYTMLHAGIQREALQFKLSAGLYNTSGIDGYAENKGEWMRRLFKNTFQGNAFAAASLTYHFGWRGREQKHRKTSSYSISDGVQSTPKVEESSSSETISGGLRSRAIFMNRR